MCKRFVKAKCDICLSMAHLANLSSRLFWLYSDNKFWLFTSVHEELFKDLLQLDTALITLLSYCKSEQVIIFSRVFLLLLVLLLTVTTLVLHDKMLYVMFNVSVELLILDGLLETATNWLFTLFTASNTLRYCWHCPTNSLLLLF